MQSLAALHCTDLRPDIVWWDDPQKSLMLAELTISYETNFEVAAERKKEKYEELVTGACNAGYETGLITLEVGSRGVINPAGFQHLKTILNITTSKMTKLMVELCKQTIQSSYTIWCCRNRNFM